jgi:IPT/TIG domain
MLPLRHRLRAALAVEELEGRLLPALLGQQLFPADNPWNQRITDAPVAANSGAILNNLISLYGDGRLHPDFGQDARTPNTPLYGIPYNVVHGNTQPKVHVVIDAYASESDLQDAAVPAGAVLEGDFQTGPLAGVNNRGDSHLLVYDEDHNVVYEFYRASRPGENADGLWHADQETVWDLKTNTFRTLGWTSADAAGLAILPGLVRPDEGLPVSQGGQGVINHAIRFTLQNAIVLNQFLYPASHTANLGNTNTAVMPPMGSRFRLKAGVDLSQLNPQARIVAQAMKDYGLILADNGSNFFFSGASYSVDANGQFAQTWNDNDVQDTLHGLKSLHDSDFEVVDLTPAVTDLSAHAGAAGATVTVVGRNFSGAAGHLQVLFGNTPATGVTVVDDSHLTAVVTAGSGTVDVRVQSGVTTASNASNYKNPIFGYGVSPVSANDAFTYGGVGTNAPPTVAQPAAATPNPVTGTTAALSVLGADDGGEAALTYTWSVVTAPSGAQPAFSANGTNAAKSSTVTFDRAGNYVFQVTLTDAGGLSTTSSVSVTASQKLARITVTPPSVTLAPGGRQQFTATAFDQFGVALATQPSFTWSLLSGIGSVSRTGLYTAPKRRTGTAVVQVTAGGLKAQATVTVSASGQAAALAGAGSTTPFADVGVQLISDDLGGRIHGPRRK